MKTKLIILVIVAAIMVSFTVVNQSKQRGEMAKSSHSGSSKYMSDKNQFN
jgi:preprotein translocase subunit SecG